MITFGRDFRKGLPFHDPERHIEKSHDCPERLVRPDPQRHIENLIFRKVFEGHEKAFQGDEKTERPIENVMTLKDISKLS